MSSAPVELSVRAVQPDDVDTITRIYAHHVLHGTGTFELVPPPASAMSQRIAAIVDAGLPFLVGELAGKVAGFAYAGPYRSRPAYRLTVEDSIYLAPDAFRRGLGRQLLRALLPLCESWGARQVVAVIGDSANEASVRLNASCGFVHIGTLRSVGWKHGRWLDTVLMQRSLGAGDSVAPQE